MSTILRHHLYINGARMIQSIYRGLGPANNLSAVGKKILLAVMHACFHIKNKNGLDIITQAKTIHQQ